MGFNAIPYSEKLCSILPYEAVFSGMLCKNWGDLKKKKKKMLWVD